MYSLPFTRTSSLILKDLPQEHSIKESFLRLLRRLTASLTSFISGFLIEIINKSKVSNVKQILGHWPKESNRRIV